VLQSDLFINDFSLPCGLGTIAAESASYPLRDVHGVIRECGSKTLLAPDPIFVE
jgi:hypothetical protein